MIELDGDSPALAAGDVAVDGYGGYHLVLSVAGERPLTVVLPAPSERWIPLQASGLRVVLDEPAPEPAPLEPPGPVAPPDPQA